MVDYGSLKDQIGSADRFNRVLMLSSEVRRIKDKVAFTVYKDLEGKINEKLHTFDYPFCDKARINVIYKNGRTEKLDPKVCHLAQQKGQKLSEYIFSNYVSAVDYQILEPNMVGSADSGSPDRDDPDKEDKNAQEPQYMIHSKEAANLMTRVDHLEQMHAESIPKITKDLDEIKSTLKKLNKKLDRKE